MGALLLLFFAHYKGIFLLSGMLASNDEARKEASECHAKLTHSREFPVIIVTGGVFSFAVVIILFSCYVLRGRKFFFLFINFDYILQIYLFSV